MPATLSVSLNGLLVSTSSSPDISCFGEKGLCFRLRDFVVFPKGGRVAVTMFVAIVEFLAIVGGLLNGVDGLKGTPRTFLLATFATKPFVSGARKPFSEVSEVVPLNTLPCLGASGSLVESEGCAGPRTDDLFPLKGWLAANGGFGPTDFLTGPGKEELNLGISIGVSGPTSFFTDLGKGDLNAGTSFGGLGPIAFFMDPGKVDLNASISFGGFGPTSFFMDRGKVDLNAGISFDGKRGLSLITFFARSVAEDALLLKGVPCFGAETGLPLLAVVEASVSKDGILPFNEPSCFAANGGLSLISVLAGPASECTVPLNELPSFGSEGKLPLAVFFATPTPNWLVPFLAMLDGLLNGVDGTKGLSAIWASLPVSIDLSFFRANGLEPLHGFGVNAVLLTAFVFSCVPRNDGLFPASKDFLPNADFAAGSPLKLSTESTAPTFGENGTFLLAGAASGLLTQATNSPVFLSAKGANPLVFLGSNGVFLNAADANGLVVSIAIDFVSVDGVNVVEPENGCFVPLSDGKDLGVVIIVGFAAVGGKDDAVVPAKGGFIPLGDEKGVVIFIIMGFVGGDDDDDAKLLSLLTSCDDDGGGGDIEGGTLNSGLSAVAAAPYVSRCFKKEL